VLIEMLKKSPVFEPLSEEDKQIFARLAHAFESQSSNLFLAPDELEVSTSVGNRFQWSAFLVLEPVQAYIKTQMAQRTQIAQRKAVFHLEQQAKAGNVQAAKEINVLSGIMSQEDQNKVVILHQIQRPKLITAQPQNRTYLTQSEVPTEEEEKDGPIPSETPGH
jgi:formyltetrahydrofolate hydrolase